MNSRKICSALTPALLSFFLCACANVGKELPKTGENFLAEAIDALSGKNDCKESEFSTEDQEILLDIKKRDFEVAEYSIDTQDGETIHRFILNSHAKSGILIAEITASRGRCSEYMFGKIID